jgi:hypothetical protein
MSMTSPTVHPDAPSYADILEKDEPIVATAIASYSSPQTYSTDEEEHFAHGTNAFHLFLSNKPTTLSNLASSRELLAGLQNTKNAAVPMKYNTRTKLTTAKTLKIGKLVTTKVEAQLIQAPAELVLAFTMDNNPNYLQEKNEGSSDVVEELVAATINDHHKVVVGRYKAFPLTHRELVVASLWRKESPTDYFCVVRSCEHPDYPLSPDFVRIFISRAFKIKALSPKTCSLSLVSQLNLNGNVPHRINRIITLPMSIKMPLNVMIYSSIVRNAADCDAAAMKELGMVLVHTLHALQGNDRALKKATEKFVHRVTLLRTHGWLGDVLFYIIRNKVRPQRSTSASFAVFSQDESLWRLAGRTFATVLIGNVTAAAAVDEWINKYPAMVEFDRGNSFFRPLMESVAAEVSLRATFGVTARVTFGASVSYLDTISDVYVTYMYFDEGRGAYAWLLVAMIILNVLIQLIIVLTNLRAAKHNRKRELFLGVLSVVTFTKPGVDAYFISTGSEKREGTLNSPLQEYAFCKAVEMFAEALPGFTLQAVAFVTSKETASNSKAAVLSLLVSAASAGLCAASITYDFDTDVPCRHASPHLYGLIPNTGRGVAYVNLFVMATLQVIAKGVSVALLFVTNPVWLGYYMACDYFLFFLYKVCMGDLWVFLPLPPAPTVPVSILYRIITKAMVDFSGTLILRLPDELGGAYFMFTMLTTLASVPLSVHLYNEYFDANEEVGEVQIDSAILWTQANALLATWAIAFSYFMAFVCVPEHRKTFYDLRTSWSNTCGYFLDFESDSQRMTIFDCNAMHWKRIAADVKAWTMASWVGWERDEPEWFTPLVKSSVPDDFIPPRFLTAMSDGRERSGSAAASIQRNTSISAIVWKKSILGGTPSVPANYAEKEGAKNRSS